MRAYKNLRNSKSFAKQIKYDYKISLAAEAEAKEEICK